LIVGRFIPNVQASWVKLSKVGALQMLSAGANDLGGVLINESITRAAGAAHGQMWHPDELADAIALQNRTAEQRDTRYRAVQRQGVSPLHADTLTWVTQTPAGRRANSKRGWGG